jgi:hypothetical protein
MSQGLRGRSRGWCGKLRIVPGSLKLLLAGRYFWELPLALASERHTDFSIQTTRNIQSDLYAGAVIRFFQPFPRFPR